PHRQGPERAIPAAPRGAAFFGRLAQLARAPRLHRGCREFESLIAHPPGPARAEVAQSVEHSTENAGVAGSIPALGTSPFLAKIKPHGEKSMAIQRNEHQERISLEEFFALIESDPEHRYELIDGYPYMMTGGSPDHF